MKEKNSALKIIGTVLLCVSALYYSVLGLSEGEVIDIGSRSFGGIFNSNNSGIMGPLLAFAVIGLAGVVFLAIAYSMNKRLIPVLIAFAVLPMLLLFIGLRFEIQTVTGWLTLAVFAAGLIYTLVTDKRFVPFFATMSLYDVVRLFGTSLENDIRYRVTGIIYALVGALIIVYAITYAVNEKKIRQSKEAVA